MKDTEDIIRRFSGILSEILNDSDVPDEVLENTPRRWVKMMMEEFLAGYKDDPQRHIVSFDGEGYKGMVIMRNIEYTSMCEHHLLPFVGAVHIAYIPNQETGRVLGASKLVRVIHIFSRRLQLQERMAKQIADALFDSELNPAGVFVIPTGVHQCMMCRGVRTAAEMITPEIRGVFEEHAIRSEALMHIYGKS